MTDSALSKPELKEANASNQSHPDLLRDVYQNSCGRSQWVPLNHNQCESAINNLDKALENDVKAQNQFRHEVWTAACARPQWVPLFNIDCETAKDKMLGTEKSKR